MKVLTYLFVIVTLVPYGQSLSAQIQPETKTTSIERKEDLDGVKFLAGLMPVENQSIKSLTRHFNNRFKGECPQCRFPDAREVLGFGAERVTYSFGINSVSIYVDILFFNNSVAYYEIGVAGIDSKEVRDQVTGEWRNSGGPTLGETEVSYKQNIDPVLNSYYREVAKRLGPIKPVAIPDDLVVAYDYLLSPLNNSDVGEPPDWCTRHCTNLEGLTAINKLLNARRADLIENVLRGYNPGGRVIAAIALLRLKQSGYKPRPDISLSLERVINLNVPITLCHPCDVKPERKAKEVVGIFVSR